MSQAAAVEPIAEPIVVASPSDVAAIECPPTNLWSDEPPLESDVHRDQIDLLIRILRWWWRDRTDVYISGNLTVYYNQEQLKTRGFRGPDFFVVLGTEKKDRKSWVVWGEQGRYPNLILEILSDSTKGVDKGQKKTCTRPPSAPRIIFGLTPIPWNFKAFIWWMASTRQFSPLTRAGSGVNNWNCIWVCLSRDCASLPPRES